MCTSDKITQVSDPIFLSRSVYETLPSRVKLHIYIRTNLISFSRYELTFRLSFSSEEYDLYIILEWRRNLMLFYYAEDNKYFYGLYTQVSNKSNYFGVI